MNNTHWGYWHKTARGEIQWNCAGDNRENAQAVRDRCQRDFANGIRGPAQLNTDPNPFLTCTKAGDLSPKSGKKVLGWRLRYDSTKDTKAVSELHGQYYAVDGFRNAWGDRKGSCLFTTKYYAKDYQKMGFGPTVRKLVRIVAKEKKT